MGLKRPHRHSAIVGMVQVGVLLVGTLAGPPARAVPLEGVGVAPSHALEVLKRYPLRTVGGESVTLSSLKGQVVVLNFWASWCGPCRREMPRLDQLNAELRSRGGRVLAVSIDEDRDNVDRFARIHGLKLPIVHDGPRGLARELDLQHVPFTIVLDRNGEVAYTTSQSDDAGIAALSAMTRQLVARQPLASGIHEGAQP